MTDAGRDLDGLGDTGTALTYETRKRVLACLLEAPTSAPELADRVGLTQSEVSNHLAYLQGRGLVATVPEDQGVRYELTDPRLATVRAQLADLASRATDGSARDEPSGPQAS
jgi:ArsR family transcriptional regulator, cadmium/lead-responsive transcriptional repressor